MSQPFPIRKLAAACLLTTFLIQTISASGEIKSKKIELESREISSRKFPNSILGKLKNSAKFAPLTNLPGGFILPGKANKGDANKPAAFVAPQCDDKWKGKKLRIVEEDREMLGRSGIKVGEGSDFSAIGGGICKAVARLDIGENAVAGEYRIKFFAGDAQNGIAEAVLEVTGKDARQRSINAQNQSAPPAQTIPDNGITVGQPKQFDERTLSLMLQGLENKLAQTQFPDPSGLYGNVGRFGGATASTSSLALSVRGPSAPSVVTTTGSGTNNGTNSSVLQETMQTTTVNPDGTITVTGGNTSNTSGATGENTTTNQQVTTRGEFAPPPAAAALQTSVYSYQPQFGIASQDLLAEQTSLFYQIVNLRLLLERSLTDRLRVQPGDPSATDKEKQLAIISLRRDQIVIGFEITINSTYKDAVAEAEISVEGAGKKDVSLVSLLPQEKTYNVASVTKDSKAIDVGAVVQFIGVGASAGKTQESMYLVKDTDTVALERPSNGTNNVKFAWQFRPVLGRRTVEPGRRQVYALVSVPNILNSDGYWTGKITATTRWRRYDKKTKIVGAEINGSANDPQYDKVALIVGNSTLTESALKPTIRSLSYTDVGNGQILLIAEGDGFTPDTSIVLGDKVLSRREDGLTIANERRLMILAPGQMLSQTTSPPLIIGRYGATDLKRPLMMFYDEIVDGKAAGDGVTVKEPYKGRSLTLPYIKAVDSVNSEVTVRLVSDVPNEKFADLFKYHSPVVLIGSKVFGLSDSPFISKRYSDTENPVKLDWCPNGKHCAALTFVAPTTLLTGNSSLTFKEFLWNEHPLTVNFVPQSSFAASGLITLGTNGDKTQLAIIGGNFSSDVRVFVGDAEFGLKCQPSESNCAEPSNNLTLNALGTVITLSPTKAQIKDIKHLLITQGEAQPQVLALTAPPPTVPKTKIVSPSPLTVAAGSSREEKLAGVNLESIKKIIDFDGKEIFFNVDKEDKNLLLLQIPPFLTGQTGEKQIKLIMKDDETVLFTIVVK